MQEANVNKHLNELHKRVSQEKHERARHLMIIAQQEEEYKKIREKQQEEKRKINAIVAMKVSPYNKNYFNTNPLPPWTINKLYNTIVAGKSGGTRRRRTQKRRTQKRRM